MSIFSWLNPFKFAENVDNLGSKVDAYVPTFSGTMDALPKLLMSGIRSVWDAAVDAVKGIGKKAPAEDAAVEEHHAGHHGDAVHEAPNHGLPRTVQRDGMQR